MTMRYALLACLCAAVLAALVPDDGDACPLLFRRQIVMPCQPMPWQPPVLVMPAAPPVIRPEPVPLVTMFGGTPQRNMVNLTAKNLPADWDIDPKQPVNIKWSAALGSKAYVTVRGRKHKAMADQLTTVSKERLDNRVGRLSKTDLTNVERAIKTQLQLQE
jgi:hypothetical protein